MPVTARVGAVPVLRTAVAVVGFAPVKNPDGRLTVMIPPASNGLIVPIVNVTVDAVALPGTRVARVKLGLVIMPPITPVVAPAETLSTVDCTVRPHVFSTCGIPEVIAENVTVTVTPAAIGCALVVKSN